MNRPAASSAERGYDVVSTTTFTERTRVRVGTRISWARGDGPGAGPRAARDVPTRFALRRAAAALRRVRSVRARVAAPNEGLPPPAGADRPVPDPAPQAGA